MEKKMFCVLPALAIITGIKPQRLAQSSIREHHNARIVSRLERMSRAWVNGALQSLSCAPVEYFEEEITHILPKTGRTGSTWIKVAVGKYVGRVSEVSEAIQADGSMVGEIIEDLENLGLEAGFVDAENELIAKEAELKVAKENLGRLIADKEYQLAEFNDVDPRLMHRIRKAEKVLRYAEKGVDYAQYRMDKWLSDSEEEIMISYSSEKEDLSSMSDETLQSMAQTDNRMLLAIVANILGERNTSRLAVLKAKLYTFKAMISYNRNWKRNNVTRQYHKVYFNTHEKSGGVYENVSKRSMVDFLEEARRFVNAMAHPRPGDVLDSSRIDPDMLKIAMIEREIRILEGKVSDYQNDLVERRCRRARWNNQQAMKDAVEETVEFVASLNSDVPAWQQYITWADAEEKASNRRAKQSPCRMAGTVIGHSKVERAIDIRWLYKEDVSSLEDLEVANEEAITEIEEKEAEIDEFDAWLLSIIER